MYHNLIAVFLMYLLNNLYESSARPLELKITGRNGQSFKNNTLSYRTQQSFELTCRLLNNQTKFEMFWMIDGVKKCILGADPLTVELVGRNMTVQCTALELPAGDGTTNLTSFLTFVRDTQTPATPTPASNEAQGVPESAVDEGKRAAPTWHVVMYVIAAAVLAVVVVAILLAKRLCKRSSNKRLLQFEPSRTETEATVYVTPSDQVRESPPLADYSEPFQQTAVDLMYSTPVPKCDRKILKNKMECDNNGSYEYVTLDKHTPHALHTANSGNARYVNG